MIPFSPKSDPEQVPQSKTIRRKREEDRYFFDVEESHEAETRREQHSSIAAAHLHSLLRGALEIRI